MLAAISPPIVICCSMIASAPTAGHRDGAGHGQRGAERWRSRRRQRRGDGALDALGVAILPDRTKRLVEGQRLDRRATGDDLGDQGVAAEAAVAFGTAVLRHRPGGRARRRRTNIGTKNASRPGDRLGNDEGQRSGRRRRSGTSKIISAAATGEGVADDFDVAEQRMPVGRRTALQCAQRQGQQLVEQVAADGDVDAQRHPLQDARAGLSQDPVEREDARRCRCPGRRVCSTRRGTPPGRRPA